MKKSRRRGNNLESRYSEDKYLISYCLNSSIFDEYDIEVNDIVPLRNVYVIYTNKGIKIFKRLTYSKERLNFIESSLEHIRKSYPYIIEFSKNVAGNSYVDYKGDTYVLINGIEGRECEVYNPVDIGRVSRALAELHLASKGIIAELPSDLIAKEENLSLGRLKTFLKKDLELIDDFHKRVKGFTNQNEFDKLFYSSADAIKNTLHKCEELIEDSDYKEFCSSEESVVLCHGDLAHHNIIIKGNEVWFLDFDYCNIDLRAKDIADFIDKFIKGCGYDMDKCRDIIMSYDKIYPLNHQEMKLIYIWLMYPRSLISILRGYYNKEKNWDYRVFLDRFTKKLQQMEDRELFLKEFYTENLGS